MRIQLTNSENIKLLYIFKESIPTLQFLLSNYISACFWLFYSVFNLAFKHNKQLEHKNMPNNQSLYCRCMSKTRERIARFKSAFIQAESNQIPCQPLQPRIIVFAQTVFYHSSFTRQNREALRVCSANQISYAGQSQNSLAVCFACLLLVVSADRIHRNSQSGKQRLESVQDMLKTGWVVQHQKNLVCTRCIKSLKCS